MEIHPDILEAEDVFEAESNVYFQFKIDACDAGVPLVHDSAERNALNDELIASAKVYTEAQRTLIAAYERQGMIPSSRGRFRDASVEAGAEAGASAVVDAQPEAGAPALVEALPEAGAPAVVEAQPEAGAAAVVEAQPEVEAPAVVDPEAGSKRKRVHFADEVEAVPEVEAPAVVEAQPEVEAPEAPAVVEAQPEVEAPAVVEAGPEAEASVAMEVEAVPEAQAGERAAVSWGSLRR